MEEIKPAWTEALKEIKQKVSQPVFEMWIKPISISRFTPEVITLVVPSEFARDWLTSNCLNIIQDALNLRLNLPVKVDFSVKEAEKIVAPPAPRLEEAEDDEEITEDHTINNLYTFDRFVVGSSNKLAFATSRAVADNPGKAYNPLFLYGGVGLGKTHLLHAIANRVKEKYKRKKFLYVSCEKFVNELIKAIGERKTGEFQNKYRHADVLLIDDVQFLSGKERTQEEFFHTFNTLYETRKQVVMTSDRLPREIPNLEERLRSRFEWGLMADIDVPDFETRVAILRNKVINNLKQKDSIPNEVLEYIASLITENIRELEGALNRVMAVSSLQELPLTLTLAQNVLKGVFEKPESAKPTLEDIQEAISRHFNIKKEDITSTRRTQDIVQARQVAMYLSRELTNHSLLTIGRWFGKKNHATVLHACEKVKKDISENPDIKRVIDSIISSLKKR